MYYFNSITLPKILLEPVRKLLASVKAKKLLLAFSGGSDSTALLYILKALQEELGFALGIAHVDHGWRKESKEEAHLLEKRFASLNIPFHLKVLDPKKMSGNLEQASRNARLQFFEKLCQKEGYEAVILAHHLNDLGETLLKRIFEGASLKGMQGMLPVTQFQSLLLLRPWLNVPKEEISRFLEENNIPYFTDPTNLNPQFLRGNMRTQMIPLLEAQFGKSILAPLARISRESEELNAFMLEKWKPLFKTGPWKTYLDCREVLSLFELRWVCREWLSRLNLDVSHDVMDALTVLIQDQKADRKVHLGPYDLEIDRGQLFLNPRKEPLLKPSITLKPGVFHWGEWEITVSKHIEMEEKRGWQAVWEGAILAHIPEGYEELGLYQEVAPRDVKLKLQKSWTNGKVPAFLRTLVPVVVSKEKGVEEFLLPSKSRVLKERFWQLKLKKIEY